MSNPIQSFSGPKAAEAPLCVLTDNEWQKLFPKKAYQQTFDKDSSLSHLDRNNVSQHALKYLIALNEPDSSILPYIQKLKAKNSPQLNSAFTEHELTALHIASMKNRIEVVKALLAIGSDPNVVDAYRWTPLHHAALISNELFNLLSIKGNKNAVNQLGGTPQNLRQILGLDLCQDERQILIQNTGAKIEASIEVLKERSALTHYTDECVYSKHFLESLWTSLPDAFDMTLSFHEHWQKTLSEIYRRMKMKPPAVIVEEEVFDNQPEYGLCAGHEMKCGEGLVEYTGKSIRARKELVPKSFNEALKLEKTTKYILVQLDAAKYGNISRFINDGWPNVIAPLLLNINGLKTRGLFIISSPEGTQEGDKILWDYGSYAFALKWGRYLIIEKDTIRKFFKIQYLKDYTKEISSSFRKACMTFNATDVAAYYNFEQRLFFPLTTPAVLIDLTLSKTVNASDWNTLLKIDESVKARLSNPVHLNWIKKLLSILIDFEKSLQKLYDIEQTQEFGLQICKTLLNLQDQLSVVQMVKGLVDVNSSVSNLIQKIQLNELKNQLLNKLKNLGSYEWENDPQFPFEREWNKLL